MELFRPLKGLGFAALTSGLTLISASAIAGPVEQERPQDDLPELLVISEPELDESAGQRAQRDQENGPTAYLIDVDEIPRLENGELDGERLEEVFEEQRDRAPMIRLDEPGLEESEMPADVVSIFDEADQREVWESESFQIRARNRLGWTRYYNRFDPRRPRLGFYGYGYDRNRFGYGLRRGYHPSYYGLFRDGYRYRYDPLDFSWRNRDRRYGGFRNNYYYQLRNYRHRP